MPLLVSLALAASLSSAPARADWERVIGGIEGIDLGVLLEGPDPYARDAEAEFKPASNTKLFVAGAALERWGADHRIPTRVRWDECAPGRASGLALLGEGDPSWGMAEHGETVETRFDAVAGELRARGIRAVAGPLRVAAADSRWERFEFPPGWRDEDFAECYGAPVFGFNIGSNCATFVVTGPTAGRWQERDVPVTLELRLEPGAKTAIRARPPAERNGTWVLEGSWARGSGPVRVGIPVWDPAEWGRRLLERALARAGIAREAESCAGTEGEAFVRSPRLAELLKPFLKDSLNPVGEALQRRLGLSVSAEGTLLEAGARELARFAEEAGAPARLEDGSGVSQLSLVTPRAMLALLRALRTRPDFPVLWDALPVAGVDGTLASRMRGTMAEGLLRAKTGTLTGTYNLSGYVPRYDASGRPVEYVPFAMLTRTDASRRAAARAAQDRVGAALACRLNAGTESCPRL
jgi:D-alanyl-D-alanine carboxypeptidase/D-alanyl-D-alanine-endopeptidase (penicillin-binding protein 4)